MNEVKRYHNTWAGERGYTVIPHPAGEFVSWEDYARLKAAFDLLDESIKHGPSTIPLSPGYYVWKESEQYNLNDENALLKAKVERLTKAGDGLYKSMLEIGCNEMADNFQYDAWWGSMNAWNAAKEGEGQP
jgi:hypothetical protein